MPHGMSVTALVLAPMLAGVLFTNLTLHPKALAGIMSKTDAINAIFLKLFIVMTKL